MWESGDYCRGDHVQDKSTVDPVNTMKAYGEVEVNCNSVLATALDEAEWSILCSGCFTLSTNLIGRWMGSRTDLDHETGLFGSVLWRAKPRWRNIIWSWDRILPFYI